MLAEEGPISHEEAERSPDDSMTRPNPGRKTADGTRHAGGAEVSERSRTFITTSAIMSDKVKSRWRKESSLYNSTGTHVCVFIREREREHDLLY